MRPPLFVSLVTLLAVFVAVIYQTAQLPKPSKTSRTAYTRLQEISKSPHPYNSYRNDDIREYLREIVTSECSSAVDESDNSTMWLSHNENKLVTISTYHEQTNLVIYLPSSKDVQNTVLLSAHFDSVSSGNGATDDGMALTVLLALVKKHCKHSLSSNLIFNFNNAEEDGLFGAQALLSHPRFQDIKSFINLEGAGAGGPAMLFRASGAEVSRAYQGAILPRSSIAGNDFFGMGFVQSQTDYVVYEPFAPGLDIAFFSPRSQYHTSRDSSKTSSAWSIEHMLSAADHSLINLAGSGVRKDGKTSKALFFDILGLKFFSYKLKSLLLFDLIILILAPILLGASFGVRSFFGKVKFVGIGRTFLSLLLQIGWVAGLTALIATMNPYIIHSSPLLYSATILLGSFTANLVSTRILISRVKDQHDLSRVMSWELSIIWYILLFISAIVSLVKQLGSTYIVTLNFVAALIVAVVSLFERSAYIPPAETFEAIVDPRESDQVSTESSPLLRREPLSSDIEAEIRRDKRKRDYRSGTTWIIKYLILIPIPLIVCLWMLYATVLPALSQTLPDGANGITIYIIVGFFSILAFFNLAPFFLSTSLSSALPAFILLLIILTITTCLKAPFDVKAPLKVYYKQVVDFDHPASSRVIIEGVPGYMESAVSQLALAQHDLRCSKGASRSKRLNTCTFPAPVDTTLAKAGITTKVRRPKNNTTPLTLQIHTIHSRICDVNLDKPVMVTQINSRAIHSLESHFRLYRRDWSEPFQISFSSEAIGTTGHVTCFWDDRTDEKIEAFDLVQAELPEWVEVVKRETGLLWFTKSITL